VQDNSRPLEERVAILENTMEQVTVELAETLRVLRENTELTHKVADDTEELRKIWSEIRAAFKIFNIASRVIRFFFKILLLPILVVYSTVYTWTHGAPPPVIVALIKLLS